jgi:hypothetical protein
MVGAGRRAERSRQGVARGHLLSLAGGLTIALGLLVAPPAAQPVAAASRGLFTRTDATYTVRPAEHLVRVSISVVATNRQPSKTSASTITRYYFDRAAFGLQSEAADVQASSGSRRLSVSVRQRNGFKEADVIFGRSLFYRQSITFRLEYDLPGRPPRADSNIRVLSAFVSFYAWSFGDLGSVRIVLPAGFVPSEFGSPMRKEVDSQGRVILSASGITNVSTWYADLTADLESALTQIRLQLPDNEPIVVRAWPEDAAWQRQVVDLLTRGAPELQELIGQPWPINGTLDVREIHTPLLEGYAGFFRSDIRQIEISENLDPLVIVHELSHAWFNADWYTGRWINEGLADSYASLALSSLGTTYEVPDTAQRSDAVAFPLLSWPPPGRIVDKETQARERYGYAASYTVVKSLLDELGPDGMRRVFQATVDHTISYPGAPAPERVTGESDWKRFLDLLEQVAGSKQADQLFRTWVVPSTEIPVLDQRDAARKDYADLVSAGAGWQPPFVVRSPMAGWTFDAARKRIAEARAVLATRDQIAAAAQPLGLSVPSDLKTAYEAALRDLAAPQDLAKRELAVVGSLREAADAVAANRDPLVSLGLLGAEPASGLEAGKAAFEAGRLDEAVSDAAAAKALLADAPRIGRERAATAGGVGLGVVVVSGGSLLLLRRHRRRRRAAAAAASATALSGVTTPAAAVGPFPEDRTPATDAYGWPSVSTTDSTGRPAASVSEEPGPYATLPPHPEPVQDDGREQQEGPGQ